MKVQIANDTNGPYFEILDDARRTTMKVHVDFQERHKIGLKSDLLAKAIGYKKKSPPKVLDLTAGLCRDSFHLACLGCDVTALEENQMLYDVLSEHIKNLDSKYKLQIRHAEALHYLQNIAAAKPDVIYYDPMFPEKTKSAKSGKESELLKILSPIVDSKIEAEIVAAALKVANQRVVVKRPLRADAILKNPVAQFRGKAVRFDVYMVVSSS
jgi:16S rRNA (guanine1516-N2)-methyltransferase